MSISKKIILSLFIVSFSIVAETEALKSSPKKFIPKSTVSFGSGITIHMTEGFIKRYKDEASANDMANNIMEYFKAYNTLKWSLIVLDAVEEKVGDTLKEYTTDMYVYDKNVMNNESVMQYEAQKIDLLKDMGLAFSKLMSSIYKNDLNEMYMTLFAKERPELFKKLIPGKTDEQYKELVDSYVKKYQFIKFKFGIINQDLELLYDMDYVKNMYYPLIVRKIERM